MRNRFGEPDPVFSVGNPVDEPSQLGKGPGKVASGVHRGKTCQTEALAGQLADKSIDVPPEELRRPSIVAETGVGLAELQIRHDLDAEIPDDLGDGEGPVPRLDGAMLVAHLDKDRGQITKHPSQPALITQGLS